VRKAKIVFDYRFLHGLCAFALRNPVNFTICWQ
jgi:hypothetical protein